MKQINTDMGTSNINMNNIFDELFGKNNQNNQNM